MSRYADLSGSDRDCPAVPGSSGARRARGLLVRRSGQVIQDRQMRSVSGRYSIRSKKVRRDRRARLGPSRRGRQLASGGRARMAESGTAGRGAARLTQMSSPRSAASASSRWGKCSAPRSSIGYTGGYNCPGPLGDGLVSADRMVTQVSGHRGPGSFGPLARTLYKARQTAIARMSAECAELGGHGVVGVGLMVGAFPAGGQEFRAIGTAVREARRQCLVLRRGRPQRHLGTRPASRPGCLVRRLLHRPRP